MCSPWQSSQTIRIWMRNSRDSLRLKLKRQICVWIISGLAQPNTKMWPILRLGLSRQTHCGHRWFDWLKLLHDVFLLMPYIIIDSNVLCIGFMNCEKDGLCSSQSIRPLIELVRKGLWSVGNIDHSFDSQTAGRRLSLESDLLLQQSTDVRLLENVFWLSSAAASGSRCCTRAATKQPGRSWNSQ